tara:strand:+ start:184 stop:384 length:201 start_codon:yes stop_codon:yes gene_type:complete
MKKIKNLDTIDKETTEQIYDRLDWIDDHIDLVKSTPLLYNIIGRIILSWDYADDLRKQKDKIEELL